VAAGALDGRHGDVEWGLHCSTASRKHKRNHTRRHEQVHQVVGARRPASRAGPTGRAGCAGAGAGVGVGRGCGWWVGRRGRRTTCINARWSF
jgi:hypothetical protein